MAYNEHQIQRVAFGNASLTAAQNPSASTSVVLTLTLPNISIPLGAIVTGIKFFPGGAITNLSGIKDGTVNIVCGGQNLGTNNRKASQAILESQALSIALNGADFVSVGGDVELHFASSDGARSAMVLDVDVYVEYLYAGSRDTIG